MKSFVASVSVVLLSLVVNDLGAVASETTLLRRTTESGGAPSLQEHAVEDNAKYLARGNFNALVAFGDSFTDNGNVKNLTNGLWPLSGVGYYNDKSFTNGPNWADKIAEPFTKSRYTNYAYGGATLTHKIPGATGPDVNIPVKSIDEQITDLYLAKSVKGKGELIKNTLHLLLGGANDFFFAYITDMLKALQAGTDVESLIQKAADGVSTSAVDDVKLLLDAGARAVVVGDQLDLSAYPYTISIAGGVDAVVQAFKKLSLLYNEQLKAKVNALQKEIGKGKDKEVILVQFSSVLEKVLQAPGKYGFKVTDKPCLSSAGVCDKPDEYLFWDTFHPTRVFHALMAEETRKQLRKTYKH